KDQKNQANPINPTNGATDFERLAQIRRQGGREHFALFLRLRDPFDSNIFKLFADEIGSEVIAERQADYSEIRDAWQELERLAIGVNHNLLSKRLDNKEREGLLSILALAEAGDGSAIERYINERLDDVYGQNATLYVPATFTALRSWLAS